MRTFSEDSIKKSVPIHPHNIGLTDGLINEPLTTVEALLLGTICRVHFLDAITSGRGIELHQVANKKGGTDFRQWVDLEETSAVLWPHVVGLTRSRNGITLPRVSGPTFVRGAWAVQLQFAFRGSYGN